MRAAPLLALALAACLGGGSTPEPIVLENVGRVCLFGPGSIGKTFFADQPVRVGYSADQCLSSSCTGEQHATCTIATTGATLEISTVASWIDLSPRAMACTADCGSGPAATCQTDPLPAGDYTFVFGAAAPFTLTIPSELDAPPCLLP